MFDFDCEDIELIPFEKLCAIRTCRCMQCFIKKIKSWNKTIL